MKRWLARSQAGLLGRCRRATVLVTLLTLAVYVRTMAPSVTWSHNGADSGDLVTAAINLGVPHPTGYPLYVMLGRLFTMWPGGEPAREVTFLSAASAALAVGVFFWIALRRLVDLEGAEIGPAVAAAWAGVGLAAFGELLWSQATIAEVYGLHALLVALWVAVALYAPTSRRPYLLAAVLGLGLAHHVTIVLLLAGLWPFLRSIRRWATPRRLLALGLCLLPGMLAYAYIPLRAAAEPVPNWGRVVDLSGFLWEVTGEVYRGYLRSPSPSFLLPRLRTVAAIWVRELGPWGLALALLGLWRSLEIDRRPSLAGLTYVLLLSGYVALYPTVDSQLYLIPAVLVCGLWIAHGAIVVVHGVQDWLAAVGRSQRTARVVAWVLAALPILALVVRFPSMDLHRDNEATEYARSVLAAAAPNALVITEGDQQTFALWYLRYGLRERPDVMLAERGLLAFSWYRENLAARHPALAPLTEASDARGAIYIAVQEVARQHPLQLTYTDSYADSIGAWEQQGPLFTLLRR